MSLKFHFMLLLFVVTLTGASFAVAADNDVVMVDPYNRELSALEGQACQVRYGQVGSDGDFKYFETGTGDNKCGNGLICITEGTYEDYRLWWRMEFV